MVFKLGYQIQEQLYHPQVMLERVKLIEKAGLDIVWVPDHFHPWFHTGAQESQAWVFMGAAAARTDRISIGTAVTTPTFRYHPAIVAQAFATLGSMFPDRILLGVGTGEAMNEVPLGYSWPAFKERAERLEEAIRIIRLLWSKDFADFKGKYYRLAKANLYTRPESPIPLYVAANGPTVAKIAGKYADGLITPFGDPDHASKVLFPALQDGAKEGGRDPSKIEMVLEISTYYDHDRERALKYARKWGAAATPLFFKLPLYDPRDIEEFGKLMSDEVLKKAFTISSEPEPFIKSIEKAIKTGFTQAYFSGTTADEPGFLEMLGKEVVPYIKSTYAGT